MSVACFRLQLDLGIATGNPGVFPGYPYPPKWYDRLMGNDLVN